MKKRFRERKRPRALTAVTWLLALAFGLTWLASMAVLTVVMAQEVYDKLYEYSRELASRVTRTEGLGLNERRMELVEYRMVSAISDYTNQSVYSGGWSDSKLIRRISYPLEAAILFYDGNGRLLHSSAEDLLFFDYCTQAEWDAGLDSTSGLHYGWIDVSEGKDAESQEDDPYHLFRETLGPFLRDVEALRVTGYFEGSELKPVIMYYITGEQKDKVLFRTDQFKMENGYVYSGLSALDRAGPLEWQLQFDRSADCNREDLVTVYIDRPMAWSYEGKALIYSGESYESLAALTESLDFPSCEALSLYSYCYNAGRYALDNLLVFDGRTYADYEGFDYESGGEPPTEFIMVTAIRSHPLSCAVRALRNIYIFSGLLVLALFWAIRSRIKGQLLAPLAEVSEGSASGKTFLPEWRLRERPPAWKETYALLNYYLESLDSLRMGKNEITRLNTALDYARTAEENRRQMTSNIAHELKTPLAVVHSYAEGLKEHIAEEKRDKYLDIILSETERMDQMVLEMLDLSRLEAGKVKLSRDEVSLIALTRSVFEKLEMAAQAKALQIDFQFPEDFKITADESRIAQVIENFATNAIKYTPAGGHITVRIQKERSGTSFAIENESEALSAEALSKVWDTFYRTDAARSGGGTGLGLAIAKNIIELHGGKCAVRNTKHGVEFSFTI